MRTASNGLERYYAASQNQRILSTPILWPRAYAEAEQERAPLLVNPPVIWGMKLMLSRCDFLNHCRLVFGDVLKKKCHFYSPGRDQQGTDHGFQWFQATPSIARTIHRRTASADFSRRSSGAWRSLHVYSCDMPYSPLVMLEPHSVASANSRRMSAH